METLSKYTHKIGASTSMIEPWWTLVFVPIWQEVVFRYIPFQFWYIPTGDFLLVGIISSIVFAFIHWYFGWRFVAAAFFAGLLYWFVMVEYGLVQAMFVHAVVNLTDLTFGLRQHLKYQNSN